MPLKLFLLGRPGCGKSKTAVHIGKIVQSYGLSNHRFKDYDILETMFHEETTLRKDGQKARFKEAENGGFDVLDASVLNEVLKILEQNVQSHISNIEKDVCIIVELARENYELALQQFSPSFLQNAYFLLINTPLETCRRRIRERVAHRQTADDHNVSDFALDNYYVYQHPPQKEEIKQRLRILENEGTWEEFVTKLDSTINEILKDAKVRSS